MRLMGRMGRIGPIRSRALRRIFGVQSSRLFLARAMAAQTDRLSDVIKLFGANVLEFFAFGREFLVYFDDFFRHLLVCVLRADGEKKIWTRGEPFVTIRIKADAQQQRLRSAFPGLCQLKQVTPKEYCESMLRESRE